MMEMIMEDGNGDEEISVKMMYGGWDEAM